VERILDLLHETLLLSSLVLVSHAVVAVRASSTSNRSSVLVDTGGVHTARSLCLVLASGARLGNGVLGEVTLSASER